MIDKIHVDAHVKVGEPRTVTETRQTLGGLIEKFTYETGALPPEDLGYFPVYTTAEGEPVSPDEALDAALAGAVLVTPFEEAHDAVHEFWQRARLNANEQIRYRRPLDAFLYVECRKREAAAWRMIGLDVESDDFIAPTGDRAFFTEAEIAELYGVDVETVRKWAGHRLPAGLRRGGSFVFKAQAILTQIRNSGPAHPPTPSKKASRV